MKSAGFQCLTDWIINIFQVSAYASLYYMLTFVLIPRFFDHRKFGLFGLSVIAWTIIVLFIWTKVMMLLSGFVELHESTLPDSFGRFVLEGVQMFVPGLILLAWESYDQRQSEEKRLHRLEKESIANELNYLKAQLNPQFLFNTLRNLKTKIDEHSPKAPDMILRLSEVLDYVLYRSQSQHLKLQEEVDVIKGFLELEKLRLGDDIQIDIEVAGDLQVPISPLVLLSVVESALKESVIESADDLKVHISINAKSEKIICDIVIGKGGSEVHLTNGLSQIRRQLELTYPDKHELIQQVDMDAIRTLVTLEPVL